MNLNLRQFMMIAAAVSSAVAFASGYRQSAVVMLVASGVLALAAIVTLARRYLSHDLRSQSPDMIENWPLRDALRRARTSRPSSDCYNVNA